MICVSKEEMKRLRERYPDIRATRTVHKYYVCEEPRVMAFLRRGKYARVNKHA